MSENGSKIDSLSIQHFGLGLPRDQKIIFGGTSGFRFFDPTDRIDMHRLQQIIESGGVQEMMLDTTLTDRQIINWAKAKGKGTEMVYAIVGSPQRYESYGKKWKQREVGEVQGFVNLLWGQEEMKTIQELEVLKILPPRDATKSYIEVSYARKPYTANRQIASGLRQILVDANQRLVAKRERKLAKGLGISLATAAKKQPEPFEMKEWSDYLDQIKSSNLSPAETIIKKSPINTIFILYIEPRNKKSVHVAKSAGFVQVGQFPQQADENGKMQQGDYVYVLDWDLLNQKLYERSGKYPVITAFAYPNQQ